MEKPDINALIARIEQADRWIIQRQDVLNDEITGLRQQRDRLQKAREYLLNVAWVEIDTAFLDKIEEGRRR